MKCSIKTNFVIDVLLFINLAAAGGTGFLMKYVLISGSERWETYGSNAETYLWGWSRHQWGDFHLVLGFVMLALLVLHLVFHWYQISCMFKKTVPSFVLRGILTAVLVPLTLVLFLFAFVLPVEQDPVKTGLGRHRTEIGRDSAGQLHEPAEISTERAMPLPQSAETAAEPAADEPSLPETHRERENRTLEIFGTATLHDISRDHSVPADSVKKFLGIPLEISDYQRMGRLRRLYGFHMSDVERYIELYHRRH